MIFYLGSVRENANAQAIHQYLLPVLIPEPVTHRAEEQRALPP